ncbi:MAG TPA: hypothetical protein VM867_04255 [Xanthobacteraceae bacterium]|nr:hypothetical protein [Xanthobacteraceae bacterium]
MRYFLPMVCLLLVTAQPVQAQEIKLEEVAAADKIDPAQLKPKTVAFSDHNKDPLIDPGTGLIKFTDWANARPVQKQLLSLYPAYEEPTWKLAGGKTRKHRLHMYVAETRFIVSRSPAAINLSRYATVAFLERVDPAIKSQTIASSDAIPNKEKEAVSSKRPDRPWCDGKGTSVCIQSRYKLEGKLPIGIMLLNKIRDSDRKVADYLEFQSEMRVLEPADIDETVMKKLTNVDTPVTGVLEQSVFHVNQIMQFGKFLAVFQKHPSDAEKTVVSAFIVLAVESDILEKRKEYDKVPVLRNLVPAQVLSGNSSFNTGNSISAGLPLYARTRVKAIATLLENDRGSAALK